MGLDLRLLPLEYDTPEWGFSHSVLELGGARDLEELLRNVPRTNVPADFSSYVSRLENGESGYGQTQDTPYGEPLQCVTAAQLLKIQQRAITKDSGPRRRAVWAYLAALDPTTRIALHWH